MTTPSPEYLALTALKRPERSRPGDMWLYRKMGIVRVHNGHRRGSRKGAICNMFHLYHFCKPALWSSPCDWRNDDANAGQFDAALDERHGHEWEYIGNIFDMLPYSALANSENQQCTSGEKP